MSCLVVTHYRPHKPVGGAPLRNWQNIHGLSRFGPVDVMSVGVDDEPCAVDGLREWAAFGFAERTWRDRLRTACWLVRPGGYRSIEWFHLEEATRWMRRKMAADPYDVVVIEGISVASYMRDLRAPGCVVVFDAHNVESVLHHEVVSAWPGRPRTAERRFKDWVLERRVMQAERRAVLGADVVWACSEHDARTIEQLYGARSVTVVPNGVDVDAYRGLPQADTDWSGQPMTLMYQGLFAYGPNGDAALRLIQDVLPAVQARGHRARVMLVGRDPAPEMLAAAQQDRAVVVTGAVESVLPFLAQPCIVALPIHLGSGTRLKILEAFAAGRPVVTTAKGAEGLDVVDGVHLLIRDDPSAMADGVIEVWTQPALRRRLCANALELVRERYSWSAAAERIARSLSPAHVGSGYKDFPQPQPIPDAGGSVLFSKRPPANT